MAQLSTRVNEVNMFKKKSAKDIEYDPWFRAICPSGMVADFIEREGNLLKWKGYVPTASSKTPETYFRYTFYTDISGQRVPTPN